MPISSKCIRNTGMVADFDKVSQIAFRISIRIICLCIGLDSLSSTCRNSVQDFFFCIMDFQLFSIIIIPCDVSLKIKLRIYLL